MIGQREFKGYWWIPDNSEDKVGGVLTFSQEDGIQLELFSAIEDEKDEPVGCDTILGITTDAEKITIKDTLRTNYCDKDTFEEEIKIAEHTANRIFVGEHFEDDPEFSQLEIEFPLLYEWFGLTGITSDIEVDDESGDITEIIRYEEPDTKTANLDDFELGLVPTSQQSTAMGHESIDEDAHFTVRPENRTLSFEDSREYLRRLQAFVTLALGKEVHPTAFTGQVRINTQGENVFPYKDIEFLYSTVGDPDQPNELEPGAENFLFSDIEGRFTTVMSDWFSKYDDLQPVFSLYFSTKYNSDMYLENEFLNLTGAIESYHRIEHGGTYLSEDEFNEYYTDLTESIPEKYDQSFKDHLKDGTFKYANKYSLRKRLNLLTSEYEDTLSVLPVDFSKKVGSITNARNNLTHRDTENSKPDFEQLIEYNDMLQALLETILLSEIEIPKTHIQEKLDIRYKSLLRQ